MEQVAGIPNARLGKIVAAWVRLRPGVETAETEIREFCLGRIAYDKISEHIRFVADFPATLSGKIQKRKIREFEIEARCLQQVANARKRPPGDSVQPYHSLSGTFHRILRNPGRSRGDLHPLRLRLPRMSATSNRKTTPPVMRTSSACCMADSCTFPV